MLLSGNHDDAIGGGEVFDDDGDDDDDDDGVGGDGFACILFSLPRRGQLMMGIHI